MRQLGFSLIELMIVLLIFGIMLSFTYPSYQAYLVRSHRLEGQLALLNLAAQMEQYFARHGSYVGASIGTNSKFDVLATPFTAQGYYRLVIQNSSETQFKIQAIPQAEQARADLQCQILEFNDQGIQSTAAGPFGNPTGTWQDCWA